MPNKTIDTHVHLWQLNLSPYHWLQTAPPLLAQNYSPQQLEVERVAAGVTHGILVQADNTLADTDYVLQTAETHNWVAGVVGWLPLTEPETTASLLAGKYGSNPYFKGVRHLIHDEADTRWLLQDTVVESLKILAKHNLPYDIVGVLPEHIETALELADRVPDLKMIFDHLNQPPIASGERFGRWGQLMKQAAAHPNFFVKISGLGSTANTPEWNADTIEPYIAFALQLFGEDRCCCGGDWPVSLLAGSYTFTWQQYRIVLARILNEAGREKLLYSNAALFYQL